MSETNYEFHPLANLFPLMDEGELAALAEDIKEHGQREPIQVHDNQIIDGRNRYLACKKAGVDPCINFLSYSAVNWKTESLTAFVLSANLHRRHLTASQKAAIAADALPFFEAEAKQRQQEAAKVTNEIKAGNTVSAKVREADKGKAAAQAAKAAKVSTRYVETAKAVKAAAPELHEQVKAGKLTISAAKKQLEPKKVSEEPEVGELVDGLHKKIHRISDHWPQELKPVLAAQLNVLSETVEADVSFQKQTDNPFTNEDAVAPLPGFNWNNLAIDKLCEADAAVTQAAREGGLNNEAIFLLLTLIKNWQKRCTTQPLTAPKDPLPADEFMRHMDRKGFEIQQIHAFMPAKLRQEYKRRLKTAASKDIDVLSAMICHTIDAWNKGHVNYSKTAAPSAEQMETVMLALNPSKQARIPGGSIAEEDKALEKLKESIRDLKKVRKELGLDPEKAKSLAKNIAKLFEEDQ
ncbi:MAG TPA: ParB N-terminal domain-containing protein [Planctomycetota bacterium]|nr:ParB N-terminal domain-containing protein [Planctomycetota bacterium]